MNESHLAYLSLGSNIQPEVHLVQALQRLQNHGTLEKVSRAWESQSVGAEGPNYLNACVSFRTILNLAALKEQVLLPIEVSLGRVRSNDKFAPRTIDIDIVLFDNRPCEDKYWIQAFVVVPLAEIYPTYWNPVTSEPIAATAARLRSEIWMAARPEVLNPLSGNLTSL